MLDAPPSQAARSLTPIASIGHRTCSGRGLTEHQMMLGKTPLDGEEAEADRDGRRGRMQSIRASSRGETLDDLQIGRFQGGTLGRLQAGSSEGGTGADLAIPPPTLESAARGAGPDAGKRGKGSEEGKGSYCSISV